MKFVNRFQHLLVVENSLKLLEYEKISCITFSMEGVSSVIQNCVGRERYKLCFQFYHHPMAMTHKVP